MKNTAILWLALGLASFMVLPWHMTDGGILNGAWISDGVASTGLNATLAGQWWLGPVGLTFLVTLALQLGISAPTKRARITLTVALTGLTWLIAQGLVITRAGPRIFESILSSDVALSLIHI